MSREGVEYVARNGRCTKCGGVVKGKIGHGCGSDGCDCVEQLREQAEQDKLQIKVLQQSLSQVAQERDREYERAEQVARLLCNLTPGGSEFADDPKRCYEWVRKRMSSEIRQLGKATAARQQAVDVAAHRAVIIADLQGQLSRTERALAEAQTEAERCRKLWLGLQSRLDPECYEHAQERLTELLEADRTLAKAQMALETQTTAGKVIADELWREHLRLETARAELAERDAQVGELRRALEFYAAWDTWSLHSPKMRADNGACARAVFALTPAAAGERLAKLEQALKCIADFDVACKGYEERKRDSCDEMQRIALVALERTPTERLASIHERMEGVTEEEVHACLEDSESVVALSTQGYHDVEEFYREDDTAAERAAAEREVVEGAKAWRTVRSEWERVTDRAANDLWRRTQQVNARLAEQVDALKAKEGGRGER